MAMKMPETVVTLTPCWYARDHHPMHPPYVLEHGELAHDRCRHCHRPIFSADLRRWHIDGGFNMESWETTWTRAYLAVVDEQQERVIARFPIDHLPEQSLGALRERLRGDFRIDDPDSTLVLRDCHLPADLAHVHRQRPSGAML